MLGLLALLCHLQRQSIRAGLADSFPSTRQSWRMVALCLAGQLSFRQHKSEMGQVCGCPLPEPVYKLVDKRPLGHTVKQFLHLSNLSKQHCCALTAHLDLLCSPRQARKSHTVAMKRIASASVQSPLLI